MDRPLGSAPASASRVDGVELSSVVNIFVYMHGKPVCAEDDRRCSTPSVLTGGGAGFVGFAARTPRWPYNAATTTNIFRDTRIQEIVKRITRPGAPGMAVCCSATSTYSRGSRE